VIDGFGQLFDATGPDFTPLYAELAALPDLAANAALPRTASWPEPFPFVLPSPPPERRRGARHGAPAGAAVIPPLTLAALAAALAAAPPAAEAPPPAFVMRGQVVDAATSAPVGAPASSPARRARDDGRRGRPLPARGAAEALHPDGECPGFRDFKVYLALGRQGRRRVSPWSARRRALPSR